MSTNLQTLILHAAGPSPNPWKVACILEELALPWTFEQHTWPDLKKQPYTSINPNGRVPALHDPNTGITLWESGAIIEYIIDTYDKSFTLHYNPAIDPQKHWACRSWLFFQVSGQGPYSGQLNWFEHHHAEKLPSAVQRYKSEVERMITVLDDHLASSSSSPGGDKKWLVGDRITYADLAFFQYAKITGDGGITGGDIVAKKEGSRWPAYRAWFEAMAAREAVGRVVAMSDRAWEEALAARAAAAAGKKE